MPTDYRAKLEAQRAAPAVMARVARSREILGELGTWIDRYRGGMPRGFAAAIAQWESNGVMSSIGDATLGEVGYYQVPGTFPPTVGVAPDVRRSPEGNVFLGLLEYQIEAVKQAQAEPLIELGTEDSWKLARLAFAVGSSGTKTLVREAQPTVRGKVFDSVRAYVDRTGGRAFGSQSAALVWYRVHTVDLVWQIGQAVSAGAGDVPRPPPAPPGLAYQIPAALLPGFQRSSRTLVVVPVALAALALALLLLRS